MKSNHISDLRICVGSFWNTTKFWEEGQPHLSPCFTEFILLVPNIGFLLCFIPWICMGKTKKGDHHQSKLRCLHMGIAFLVFFASTISAIFGYVVQIVNRHIDVLFCARITTEVLASVVFILTIVIMTTRYVVPSQSIYLVTYLIVSLLLYIIPAYNICRQLIFDEDSLDIWNIGCNASFLCRYCLVMLLFGAMCISPGGRNTIPSNKANASVCSSILFSWLTITFWLSKRKKLTSEHVGPVLTDVSVLSCYPNFERVYDKHSNYRSALNGGRRRPKNTLTIAIIRLCWCRLLLIFSLGVISGALAGTQPLFVDFFLTFIDDGRMRPGWQGYFVAALLSICLSVRVFARYQALAQGTIVGVKVKSVLASTIFQKASMLSCVDRGTIGIGMFLNLISVDVQKIAESFLALVGLSMAAGNLIVIIPFLIYKIGVIALAPFALVVVLVSVSLSLLAYLQKLMSLEMILKDKRLDCFSSSLQAIKTIKYNAWEKIFTNLIKKRRVEEFVPLQKGLYLTAFLFLLDAFSVFGTTFVTIGLLLINRTTMTPSIVFAVFNAIWVLSNRVSDVLIYTWPVVNGYTSLNRIQSFCNYNERKELSNTNKTSQPEDEGGVDLSHCSFSWKQNGPDILEDICLKASSGKLIAVVGAVGSGKTALLCALLSELYQTQGSAHIHGRIAYVPSEAMVLNMTIRENIVFGAVFDAKRYHEILAACGLQTDINNMADGDYTEVGDRGITLSGGQKQRIGLARAVYHDLDVYLMDDSLSAVDSITDNHIFDEVIGPRGTLSKKCRILVTNRMHNLHNVDNIYVLQSGRIVQSGTFDDIKKAKLSIFAEDVVNSDKTSYTHGKIVDGKHSKSSLENKLVQIEDTQEGTVGVTAYWQYICAGSFVAWVVIFVFSISSEISSTLSTVYLGHLSAPSVTQFNYTDKSSSQDYNFMLYSIFVSSTLVTKSVFCACVIYATLRSSKAIFEKTIVFLFGARLSFFDCTPTGRIANRIGTDMEAADHQLPVYWLHLFESTTLTVIRMSYICITLPIFIPFLVFLLATFATCNIFYISLSRTARRLESTTRSHVYSHCIDMFSNVTVIRSLGSVDRFCLKFHELLDDNAKYTTIVRFAHVWYELRAGLIGLFPVLVVALVGVVNRLYIHPNVFGVLITFAFTSAFLLDWTTSTYVEVEKAMVSIERLLAFSSETHVPQERTNGSSPPKYWPRYGELDIQNIVVRHRPGIPPVFDDLSLSLYKRFNQLVPNDVVLENDASQKGQLVGVVGCTGAGKSSLVSVIVRSLELDSGSVLLDGIDISTLAVHNYRQLVSVLPQEPILFEGTVRFNLDPTLSKSDSEIWAALEKVQMMSKILCCPSGLDSQLCSSDETIELSSGERQLMCLARILLRQSRLVILDEATASIDRTTEDLVMKTVKNQLTNSTVIIIAHRVVNLMHVDRIISLDRGRVVEDGRPEDLLSTPGSLFLRLAKESGLV